jgi:hypothetical protein
MIGVDNTTRRSEGPLAGCATTTAKTAQIVEEPRGSLGPVTNSGGVEECGRSTAQGKAG